MVDTDLTRSGAEKKNARKALRDCAGAKRKNFNFHPFSGSIKMHVMPGNLIEVRGGGKQIFPSRASCSTTEPTAARILETALLVI